ncbi:hypothetical protein RYX36_004110 [Vicia faba]
MEEHENGVNAIEDEPIVGPGPSPRARLKRPLQFEQAYLDALPSANMYEKSYMHRDVVTHVAVSAAEFFIIGSADGHLKFWKKRPIGIEFAKHFFYQVVETLFFIQNQSENGANAIEDEPIVGPGPSPRARLKRPLQFEQAYLDALPSANMYEKSYMHRDVVTHVAVSAAEFFIIGSADGHLKFWKKRPIGIEFAKHFFYQVGNF